MEDDKSLHNRRVFARIPFTGKVTVTAERLHWTASLIDISMKGVLISRPMEWPDQAGDVRGGAGSAFAVSGALDNFNPVA